MVSLLLNKFLVKLKWLIILVLVTSRVTASILPPADTCQSPNPPVITGSAKAICRNESVQLTATGCVGTVVWSNGEIGATIEVKPQQTTKYTAICRAQLGCISCFADVWKVTVNTPEAPVLSSSQTIICPDDAITLTATNCKGTVRWPDQTTGAIWTGRLRQTTGFQAVCEQNGCVSTPSKRLIVQVTLPQKPIISATNLTVCAGQSVDLIASGCLGTVHWTDGSTGSLRTVTPGSTTAYQAVCQVGSCKSESSAAVSVTVHAATQEMLLVTPLTNGCPYQTADLASVLTNKNPELSNYYQFRTGPTLSSVAVQSPGAVGAGTYYIFGRSHDGCYTAPVAVEVTIKPCKNAIPPCLSDPARVTIQLDSLDWTRGVVRLTAQLGGSASAVSWQNEGGGLFTETSRLARYLLSETDRQLNQTVFTASTPDPDGAGPCVGSSTQKVVSAPSNEIIGLSKKVSEPVWITEGGSKVIELAYQLTVVNMGRNTLTNVQIIDDLNAAFSASGAAIRSVNTRADNGLVVNPAYTGQGANTALLTSGRLAAGQKSHVWLTVRLDVSQANTLTFNNEAIATGLDSNGGVCLDRSTNGIESDPDKNGNPGDNSEPTPVTLHSLQPDETEDVFIPEGFSPNGDGINDLFVIKYLPTGVSVQLDIYNRWGHLVYRNMNYKNDWDGKPNQGINATVGKEGLPDGTYYYQIKLSDGREFVRFLMLAR